MSSLAMTGAMEAAALDGLFSVISLMSSRSSLK